MQERGIVHARLLTTLTPNFYPSLCTMQEPHAVSNASGDETTAPTAVTGLVDLACRIAPANTRETRAAQQTYVEGMMQVDLAGYYPSITSKMIAVIDGKSWSMEGEPQSDGQQATTRFFVREVA